MKIRMRLITEDEVHTIRDAGGHYFHVWSRHAFGGSPCVLEHWDEIKGGWAFVDVISTSEPDAVGDAPR